jgi:dienelactone hydrolase
MLAAHAPFPSPPFPLPKKRLLSPCSSPQPKLIPTPHSIADQFAANGYFVVMPDLFYGDAVKLNRPPDFNLMGWLQNHLPVHVDPIIETVLKEMRGPLGCKRIGGVGYCFGGKYVCRFLKEGGLDAGYTAHPSFVEKEELEGITGPLSISAAGMLICALFS